MRLIHLPLLVCPECAGELFPEVNKARLPAHAETLDDGELVCGSCGRRYPVKGGIPRFVPAHNYAGNFAFQWRKFALTQYDSHSGQPISANRFFASTGWPADLSGQTLLEIGGGAGRLTEVALATGATVISADLSSAIEVNWRHNGKHPRLLAIQADMLHLPLRANAADRLFCFGVLQHTPDTVRAFAALPRLVRPGGELAIDVYRRYDGRLPPKYLLRHVTRHLPTCVLYPLVVAYVMLLWPLLAGLRRLSGRGQGWRFSIADYRGVLPLNPRQQREWAVLDTFDMLSPRYDRPFRKEEVETLFRDAGLTNAEVFYGENGIVGRTRLP